MQVPFQQGLFGGAPSFEAEIPNLQRIWLDDRSWLDLAPQWVQGADLTFVQIVQTRRWGQRTRRMYDHKVKEPRLTAPWNLRSGLPLEPKVLDDIRLCLSARYGVLFDSAGFNFYRDGQDSVAWHGDRIRKEIEEPIVALVSFGEPRKFLLRPKGGGKSMAFHLGRGDLFVTGGRAQRDYEHCVPKVAHAGPRISVAFRYGMSATAPGAAASEY